MIELGDEKPDPRSLVGKPYVPVHPQRVGQRLKTLPDLVFGETASFEIPLDTGKKTTRFKIDMLVGMKDIAVMMKNKIRDFVNQTLLILACHEQRGCLSLKVYLTRFVSIHALLAVVKACGPILTTEAP